MKNIIRTAIIGYGYASKAFHVPLIRGTPGLALVSVVSRDAAKVHADLPDVTVVNDASAIFSDPGIDLVIIPTPNETHFPLAKAALEAGKHVVVDKPFTITRAEAVMLDQLAKKQGCLLFVFHNRRWDSDFLTVSELLRTKRIGDLRYFESHFDRYRPEVRQRWREQQGEGSGIWFDLAPHLLDQAIQLFGMPQLLFVDLATLRPGAQTTDYFHALLTYPEHRVVLHASLLVAAESPRFQLHGTNGSYICYGLDPQEGWLKEGELPSIERWSKTAHSGTLICEEDGKLQQHSVTALAGDYPAYYASLRDAIQGEGENQVTAQQAIDVMTLIELGMESAKRQQAMPVTSAC
ncbi:MAG: putative oxidoreductase YdgJ [Candidatus Erwinia impunctatus]|nr:putative oxidoreductase YdgJ [Culicoides impunctatus]